MIWAKLLALIPLLLSIAVAQEIATYEGGTVTAADLRAAGGAAPDERERAIQRIVWVREMIAEHGDKLAPLPPAELNAPLNAQYECVAASWREKTRLSAKTTAVDLLNFARAQGSEFTSQERRRVDYIYREWPALESEQGKIRETKFLTKLLEEIQSGAVTFEDAARRHSMAANALRGGDFAHVERNATRPTAFTDLVFAQAAGTLTGPHVLNRGAYLLRVGAIEPARTLSAADIDASPTLKQSLIERVRDEELQRAMVRITQQFPNARTPEAALREHLRRVKFAAPDCAAVQQFTEQRLRAEATFIANNPEVTAEPTDEEIQANYLLRKGTYVEPAGWQLTRYEVLWFGTSPGKKRLGEECLRLAIKARASVTDGIPDEALEREGSVKITALQGWVKTTGEPEADRLLATLRTGDVTAPIWTPTGVAYFRIRDRRTATLLPLEKVRDRLIAEIKRDRRALALSRAIEYKAAEKSLVYQFENP